VGERRGIRVAGKFIWRRGWGEGRGDPGFCPPVGDSLEVDWLFPIGGEPLGVGGVSSRREFVRVGDLFEVEWHRFERVGK